jgi:two-component system nitrogen regulation response regulator GlnG
MTTTVDPDEPGPRRGGDSAPPALVELLFHYDLQRIGACTDAALLAGGDVVTVGRDGPRFAHADGSAGAPAPATGGRGAPALPLADPCISRRHLELRWLSLERQFEIRPCRGARLPVAVVRDPVWRGRATPVEAELVRAEQRARVSPGTLVTIGQRVMLHLRQAPLLANSGDRLGLIGESLAMWTLRDRVRRVAGFAEPVLVLGETGSGKELVARAIHGASGRSGRFVALNLSQLDAALANAELFGHSRGAFTGAVRERAGCFEEAQGGTLFLDEIGDASLEVQKKLLRVLEERKLRRLGESREIDTDARIVAATHRDLATEVGAGRFRLDLFERVGALCVQVPPLRDHREDIPPLFVHFLATKARGHAALQWLWRDRVAADAPPVPLGVVADLMSRPWAGNVRELRNFVAEAAALNVGSTEFVVPGLGARPVAANESPAVGAGGEAADDGRARPASREASRRAGPLDRDALLQELEQDAFNQTSVAARLRISRTTLLEWMRSHGIRRPKDLVAADVRAALATHGADLASAARTLGVSLHGLKLYLRRGPGTRGDGDA